MRIRWKDFELPTQIVFEEDSLQSNYGKFIVEPFERGYGNTIGNSLRRVLLSSIEGCAVTSVLIKGVQHEFSTIEGVFEDVTEIILNVKKLAIKMNIKTPKTIKLSVQKKGEVTSGDITPDPEIEIVDPTQHIATLTDKVKFEMEMVVEKGRGYKAVEDEKGASVGTIKIASIFSPVKRVKYQIENTRVGKLTNYDRLVLEVWTDGTISPEKAIVESAKILRKHLNPFVMYYELGKELKKTELKEEENRVKERYKEEVAKKLELNISELDLSVRASNCLTAENINTIKELVSREEAELLKVRNFGKTSLKEVKKKLATMGLSFGMNVETVS